MSLPNPHPKVFALADELQALIIDRLKAEPGLNNLDGLQVIAGTAALAVIRLVPAGTDPDNRKRIYLLAVECMAAGLTAAHKSLSSNDTSRN